MTSSAGPQPTRRPATPSATPRPNPLRGGRRGHRQDHRAGRPGRRDGRRRPAARRCRACGHHLHRERRRRAAQPHPRGARAGGARRVGGRHYDGRRNGPVRGCAAAARRRVHHDAARLRGTHPVRRAPRGRPAARLRGQRRDHGHSSTHARRGAGSSTNCSTTRRSLTTCPGGAHPRAQLDRLRGLATRSPQLGPAASGRSPTSHFPRSTPARARAAAAGRRPWPTTARGDKLTELPAHTV